MFIAVPLMIVGVAVKLNIGGPCQSIELHSERAGPIGAADEATPAINGGMVPVAEGGDGNVALLRLSILGHLDQPRRHLADFVTAYNFTHRLKTLKGLTPHE
jgi:hypothetical protein